MATPTTELLLRVNGVQAAFGIELGFDSQRANEGRRADPYRQANVSFSLVQRREGRVVRHTLIDVGFVVRHGGRRIILTGDFLHVPDEDNPLLFGADVCFLDANTWHPAEWTWHQSVLGSLRLIEKWKPKRTYVVHYSGYEDRDHPDDPVSGPMSLDRLREELRKVAGGHDVQPAVHGMILGGETAWPE